MPSFLFNHSVNGLYPHHSSLSCLHLKVERLVAHLTLGLLDLHHQAVCLGTYYAQLVADAMNREESRVHDELLH